MYLDHFGLKEPPFRITPHTEFFFSGANRGATLEALIYAITNDEGIVKVSGEVGSGKTMLCRMLLERLPPEIETVYLANPSLDREEIRHAIADELGTPLPEQRNHLLLRALQARLIELYAAGRTVVVMIDEAHAMPAETLEEIRLLSNLESSRHKLLHIALFGQPELDARLAENAMRPLKERITHNFALAPLRENDVGAYLMFRLRTAGYKGADLFTPAAVLRIAKASEGLTRRINILADKALLAAYADNLHQIDLKQADAAIRDAQFRPMRPAGRLPASWAAAAAALLLSGGAYHYLTATPRVSPPPPEPHVFSLPPLSPALPPTAAPAPLPSGNADALPPQPTTPQTPPTLAERLAESERWIRSASNERHFIQLHSAEASNPGELETYLATSCTGLAPQLLRVYRSALSGRDRFGVIYGDYPSRDAAAVDLPRVAQACASPKAYVRAVNKLR